MNTTTARATGLTSLLHDAPDPTDHERVRKYVHRLAEAGLAVLLIWPGSKEPADMRIPQKRSADDRKAQEAAKIAGRRDWRNVKAPSGLTLATTDVDVLDKYLDRYTTMFSKWVDAECNPTTYSAKSAADLTMSEPVAVNLAVEVGSSGVVVVDCDTAAQMQRWWDACEIDPEAPAPAPTVRSPGYMGINADPDDPSTWLHNDGGHFWFTVPDGVELPTTVGAITCGGNDGFAVLWDRRYVLIPPSVRAEGSYRASGEVHELPGWLRDAIIAESDKRRERAAQRREGVAQHADGSLAQRIDAWAERVSWREILEPHGWLTLARPDSCGCEIYTAPGAHASPKSATAHNTGCVAGIYRESNAPLHFWTDHDRHPFDAWITENGDTLSKLQAVAAAYYDNDTGAAMTGLGLTPNLSVDFPLDSGCTTADDKAEDRPAVDPGDFGAAAHSGGRRLRITWASEIEPAPVKWLWVDISTENTALVDPFCVGDICCVAKGRSWSPPDVETEGRIACGMISVAAGREGSGKSSFGIWTAAKITRGELPGTHYGAPQRVYYLATEDSWKHTLVPRLMAAGADLSMIARVEVVVNESDSLTLCLPDDVRLLAESIIENEIALVVVDPLMSTINDSLSTNNTREVRTALEPLAAMADQTGASVVCIAHFNKATGLDAASRISGSGAFKDLARAVMVFAVGADGERVFSQPKNSVGRNDLPSLSYAVIGAVVDTPTGKTSTSVLRFTSQADQSVEDMLADERGRNRRKSDVTVFLGGIVNTCGSGCFRRPPIRLMRPRRRMVLAG